MEQTKTYAISERRTLTVNYMKEDDSVNVRIQDKFNENRCALLTASRWAVLLAKVDIIDEALNNLFAGVDDVDLRHHLGSAWWILVKSAYYFGVDIHKCSLPRDGKQQKLAGPGITLAWEEWNSLKQLIPMIHEHYRPLSTDLPCHQYPMHDHQVCLECNPSSLHKH